MSNYRYRFDQFTRYRIAALLFVALYVFLMSRAFLNWPDWGRGTAMLVWFTLTTPALILVLWNVVQSSIVIYRKRRTINQMLDERQSEETSA
jgi:phosphatidylglycerophosphate synthase